MTDFKNSSDYKRGIEIFKEKYEPSHISIIDDLYKFSPELADIVVAHGLCDIWERKTPNLSIKEKEIAVLTALVCSGTVHNEIKAHAFNCLNVGMTKQQVIEVLSLLTLYIGVPKVILASKLVNEAFLEYDETNKQNNG